MMALSDLEKLAKQISALDKPDCRGSQELMKRRIMNSLREGELEPKVFSSLMSRVKALSAETRISVASRVRIKAVIFDQLEKVTDWGWAFVRRLASFVAPAVLASFSLFYVLMIQTALFDVSTVKATIISEIEGTVFVIRDGKKIPVVNDMELYEKDIITTGDNSFAAIRYLDDSVSRLDEHSSVVLNRLYAHSKKKTLTVVEVELIEGGVWNKVVNIVDDSGSQFNVKAKKVAVKASNKAAFNVTTNESEGVKVKVVQNVINVQEDDNLRDVVAPQKQVPEGFEAVIKDDGLPPKSSDIVVLPEKKINVSDDTDQQWISKNLQKDEAYVAKLMEDSREERKKIAGTLPTAVLYPVKEMKGSAEVLLTWDEVAKEKLKFDIAHRKFKEAQVLLDEGDVDRTEAIFSEFKDQAVDYSKFIGDLERSDPETALDLKIHLNDVIDMNIKDLETVSSDDAAYKAKETLSQVNKVVSAEEGASEVKDKEGVDSGVKVTDDAVGSEGDTAGVENSNVEDPKPIDYEGVPLMNYFDASHPVAKERQKYYEVGKTLSTSQVIPAEVYDENGSLVEEVEKQPELGDSATLIKTGNGQETLDAEVFSPDGVDMTR